ncbi:metallophosphoesterase family protein [Brucella thiophenivorans]|uniref:metallophosphoesterase n=1 Tax=Brucella thiophenivorans TaxID=571255 RepID=UPI001F369B80|nr:metallophosphoesterase [Brucella thiophenivorans]
METDRQTIKEIETLSLNWSSRFYFLDEDELFIGNTRFLGATLWVDFQMNLATSSDLQQRMWEARGTLHDFRAIYMRSGKRFTPEDMLNLHQSNADYIRGKLSEPFNGSTITVTHYMPHPDCTPRAYAGMKANYLFANSDDAFDRLLHSDIAPVLWICSHTYHAFDTWIGRTRIVCNPFGYKWEQGRNEFQWKLVIEAVAKRENE